MSAMGMPCAWMGVGDWYSRSLMSSMMLAWRFCAWAAALSDLIMLLVWGRP